MASKYEQQLAAALAEELAALDLPLPERQHLVTEGRRWRLDFAWPQSALAVEIDGGNWQGLGHTRRADYIRRRGIISSGWRCYWYHTDEIKNELPRVIAEIVYLVQCQEEWHGRLRAGLPPMKKSTLK